MEICAQCGNEYDNMMRISYAGNTYAFDSFECAIQALAPQCVRCGCKIVGHGVQSGGRYFCCAHCAQHVGATDVVDHGK